MADRIHVVPAHLREAAGHHQETSEYLRTLPSSHEAIQQSLDSLGPIFGELREAGRELLEQRRLCYEQQLVLLLTAKSGLLLSETRCYQD